ncbi:MAG TPA: tetratricopeptide repeat protein [Tepidisphaeraceae bacterium]
MTPISLQQTLEEAVRLHQAGHFTGAEQRYRQIRAEHPDHVESIQRLGILLHQTGRGNQAIELLRRAVELSPNTADSQANLGTLLASQGQFEEAIQAFQQAVRLRPEIHQLHLNLANALRQTSRFEEAAKVYRQALGLKQDLPEAWNYLGVSLQELGKSDEAISAFERAIALNPTWAEALNNLAIAHHLRRDFQSAIGAYRRAAAIAPQNADTHDNLSAALQEIGSLPEALAEVQIALSLRPNNPGTLFNLGNALRDLGRAHEALEAYQKAIAVRPDYAEAFFNLGSALKDVGRVDDAILSLKKSIELRPTYGEAYSNLAVMFRDKGELDASIDAYRSAIELTHLPRIAGNLLYTLHFHPDYDSRRLYEEHVLWHERYAKPVEDAAIKNRISPTINVQDRDADRRLKIGYISCDFHNHPVGRFLLPLLANHDHQKFGIYCYSDTLRPDSTTNELRSHAAVWHNTLGMDDERFSGRVREDQIDILVDLSLHARTGRMMALATKPAPVQVTYLAYCSTSGLRTMDYRISDPYLDPPGSDLSVYFEKTIRLKSYWCYPGAPFNLPVAALPALSAGYITFGSLNTFAKVTAPTLRTWCRILMQVPQSKLMIHAHPGDHRDRVRAYMFAEGVDPARINFVGFLPGAKYFEQYNSIDIGLDPFPYAGGTTTCDALWMGVPVVSLTGGTAVSRGGLSILSTVGVPNLVAANTDRYVEIAAELAGDLPELEQMRSALRTQMQSSPLLDGRAFAADVETAYRSMWRDHLGG